MQNNNNTISDDLYSELFKSNELSGFYKPSENASSANHTIVSSAYRPSDVPVDDDREQIVRSSMSLQNRIIVGMLFSVSRTFKGEVFPVYLGRNVIGTAPDSDISLMEKTVDERHGILLVRRHDNVDGTSDLIVSVTDYDSDYGTQVDGKRVGEKSVTCANRSKIRIGTAYELELVIFDENRSLKVANDFISIGDGVQQQAMPQMMVQQPPVMPQSVQPQMMAEQPQAMPQMMQTPSEPVQTQPEPEPPVFPKMPTFVPPPDPKENQEPKLEANETEESADSIFTSGFYTPSSTPEGNHSNHKTIIL